MYQLSPFRHTFTLFNCLANDEPCLWRTPSRVMKNRHLENYSTFLNPPSLINMRVSVSFDTSWLRNPRTFIPNSLPDNISFALVAYVTDIRRLVVNPLPLSRDTIRPFPNLDIQTRLVMTRQLLHSRIKVEDLFVARIALLYLLQLSSPPLYNTRFLTFVHSLPCAIPNG